MRSALSSRAGRSISAAAARGRQLATHATTTPADTATDTASLRAGQEGALRPHLGVEVNPNHGLWAFFRRKEQDGKVSYETVEPMDVVEDKSGTSQHTLHLRRVFKLGLVNRRSGMDSGGVEAEELQGPAHAVVCRLAGAEPARDAAGRGPEAWGERAGSWAVGQGVQGMYSFHGLPVLHFLSGTMCSSGRMCSCFVLPLLTMSLRLCSAEKRWHASSMSSTNGDLRMRVP